MSKPSSANPGRSAESWAEVHAHDQVMRYRRSGAGRAVLLLRPIDRPDSLWPELVVALGAHFRLIAPDVPQDEGDVTKWLSDFLEGIGMPSMGVLAAAELCQSALALAVHDSDQVARLVLVANSSASEAELRDALAMSTRAGMPLLVVRRDLSVDEVLPQVTRFLAGE